MERLAEVLLLVGLGLPVVRLLAQGPVRAELSARPGLLLGLVGFAGVGLSVLVIAAARADGSLRILTLLAVGAAILAWWRARPGYGKRRGLPPGSLGLASSMASLSDPGFYARQAERHGTVFKMSQFHQPTVCIVDLPLGFAFLEDCADCLEQPRLAFAEAVPGNYIELMNGEPHRHYRGIFQPAFNGAGIRESRSHVGEIVRRELGRMAGESADGGTSPDPFLDRIAFECLLCFFFGVRAETEAFASFERIYQQMGHAGSVATDASPQLVEAVGQASDAIRALAGDPDLDPHCALGGALRAHPECADDPVFLGNLAFMLQIARNNTSGFLAWVLKLATDPPDWQTRLREAGPGAEALATRMVSETLRLSQSEYVYRVVTRECRLGEFRIPAGWLVRVCLRECHRRPDLFPEPERFDPDRFLDMSQGKLSYAPFGHGEHSCFSGALVTMIGRTFLVELARGFETRRAADGPPERGNRHWNHWKPSSAYRLEVRRRSSESIAAGSVGA